MTTPPLANKGLGPKIEGELAEVVQELEQFSPESVFIYGSRARDDYLPTSDHEVGVLFTEDKYVGRTDLAKAVGRDGFSIYPFKLEDFFQYKPDTPFQKTIYMRELIEGGSTLAGKNVLEQMRPPKIRVLDLLQATRFNMGYALAAVIANRNGDKVSAGLEFSKSCLFCVRCLEIASLKKFPLTYGEMHQLSSQVIPPEYQVVVDSAYQARQEHLEVEADYLFKNISLLNQVIEPSLMSIFEQSGNVVVLP